MLEAMAVGTPCVATSLATRGLQVKPGRDLLVADDAETFARQVLLIFQDEALNKKIAQNARGYVERHHNWKQIGHELDQIYYDLLESLQ